MKERHFPRARVDCLSREFGDEVLVYDLQRDQGHCLNSTAAATWKLCDGYSSPSQIAKTLSRQFSAPVDEAVVLLGPDHLADAHLLIKPEVPVERLSRRVAMRRIGIAAAIALPVITSIVAPTPAHAASCFPNGHPCTSPAQCCSGLCGPVSAATSSAQNRRHDPDRPLLMPRESDLDDSQAKLCRHAS
jgi:coenzyme PQQ synthesis protein D (PqqD)